MVAFYQCSTIVSAYLGLERKPNRLASSWLAKLKKKEDSCSTTKAKYVRNKILFELVKLHVMSIRGSPKKWFPNHDEGDAEVMPRIGVIETSNNGQAANHTVSG